MGGKSYRQKSDLSSASDNSSAATTTTTTTTTQRRLNRPGTLSSSLANNRGTTSKLACTANLASSSSQSTNNQPCRRKPQPFASTAPLIPGKILMFQSFTYFISLLHPFPAFCTCSIHVNCKIPLCHSSCHYYYCFFGIFSLFFWYFVIF